jgi:nucleotide-binding universal stress UspA family protein
MAAILCATRGGEASIRAQMQAITLAKERQARLWFLYVADVNFMDHIGGAVVVDVATELEHMGEFLLLLAQERARKAGVQADILIKRGHFRRALVEAAREVEASLIVLGRPGKEGSLTPPEYLAKLANRITQETGIETLIV